MENKSNYNKRHISENGISTKRNRIRKSNTDRTEPHSNYLKREWNAETVDVQTMDWTFHNACITIMHALIQKWNALFTKLWKSWKLTWNQLTFLKKHVHCVQNDLRPEVLGDWKYNTLRIWDPCTQLSHFCGFMDFALDACMRTHSDLHETVY